MNEKEKKIIEESMKLFAEKGYHATSIQEIARRSNVSKGAFYLHFESKADLAIAIFKYYSELIMEKIEQINKQDLDARQKLEAQITLFLDMLSEHKEYIIMHFRDNLQLGDQFDEIIIQINQQGFQWMADNLRLIYGEKMERYIVDAAIQLEGILSAYFKWIVMHDLQVEKKDLATFIVRRMDNLIQGMFEEQQAPQIQLEHLNYKGLKDMNQTSNQEKASRLVNNMMKKLNQLPLVAQQKKELQEAAELITEELAKTEPKKVIIQGMLTHFQAIPELRTNCQELAKLLHVQLLTQDLRGGHR